MDYVDSIIRERLDKLRLYFFGQPQSNRVYSYVIFQSSKDKYDENNDKAYSFDLVRKVSPNIHLYFEDATWYISTRQYFHPEKKYFVKDFLTYEEALDFGISYLQVLSPNEEEDNIADSSQ
jgi:hypothetical protein